MRRGAPLGFIADAIQNTFHERRPISKRTLFSDGYTVVEVMIFLAVTAMLFGMIITAFSGQRGRAQFSTSAREMESRMQDLSNDVSTGFYPSSNNFRCRELSGEPRIQNPDAEQGTNEDCVYLGRVIHFDVNGDPERYNVYSVVGLRQSGGRDPVDYTEVRPTTDEILVEEERLPGGIDVGYVKSGGPSGSDINGVGYFSTLGSLDATGASLQSGSLSVNVISILGGGGSPTNTSDMVDHINNDIDQPYVDSNSTENGVTICFDSATSDQHAILTTGGNNRQLTTDIEIRSGSC